MRPTSMSCRERKSHFRSGKQREKGEETHEEETKLVLRHVLTNRVSFGVVVRTLGKLRSDCPKGEKGE